MDDDKKNRHTTIADLLRLEPIKNQNDLMKALKRKGLVTTQTTLSRDLLEMKVSKVEGFYKIIGDSSAGPLWIRALKDQGLSAVAAGEVLIVVRVQPGSAQMVSRAIESQDWPELVGAVAGDDTIFIATQHAKDQKKLLARLVSVLHN